MAEILEKLRPDRDLQCYFEKPSAIAALSASSPTGFTVSGAWRQQFDWAVVEWNRDNVIEHPAFRCLPDGDLSGLTLTYEDRRSGCIPFDSDLFPTVEWPYLRVWAVANGVEDIYKVRLKDYAVPVQGSYVPASADLQLSGSVTAGDYVGISFQNEHFTYQTLAGDTIDSVVQAIVDSVNSFSNSLAATKNGTAIHLVYRGPGQSLQNSTTGINGNRLGVYGFVSGAGTESWLPMSANFSGGQSPNAWRVTLDFAHLTDILGRAVPTTNVRKLRWTWAADLQSGAFQNAEFSADISAWTVTGSKRQYSVAGHGSRRIENDDQLFKYTGVWKEDRGNFSGGSIHYSIAQGASVKLTYSSPGSHRLLIGTRRAFNSPRVTIQVDSKPAQSVDLLLAGEDVLVRLDLGVLPGGSHTVTLTHAGPAGKYLYFDFVELAQPAAELPDFGISDVLTLATDWDTDHSLAISPERSAWLIHKLGFHGRQNHYVGALWFYELMCKGQVYASATVDFAGTPVFSQTTQLTIGRKNDSSTITINHLNRIGDTADTIAKAFEIELNSGYTAIRAVASGPRLTVYARAMGASENAVTLTAAPTAGAFTATVSTPTLTGGTDGVWVTDTAASPRINRACRDWSRSFYQALAQYGIEVTAAFSMELQHGDTSVAAGIAQRYPNGNPALLNTPALQTNFSPISTAFWREVYRDMATVMVEAGVPPFLQFGEVQWWYFEEAGSGMPLYDDYTKTTFQATYGRPMAVITSHTANPAPYQQECQFLPTLIGQFTDNVIQFVKATYPQCLFEVLYPTDVNDTPLNRLINFPVNSWTPSKLSCLKTESFSFTFERNVDKSKITVGYPETRGFSTDARSFLVGINDPTTPWTREIELALGAGHPSIVLFALDQFCLVGYALPLPAGLRRSAQMG